ncbi:MAG: leucine-rich repeat protein [Bacillota bacterium]|nr:leucine-rich repeat protein [Bacillota bacterium]
MILVSMIMGVTPVQAETSGDYIYIANGDGTCTINGYVGMGRNVEIPSTLDGLAVTSIGEAAFDSLNITSVTISEGVTSIGNAAFSGCSRMTSITIPEGVTSIGNAAFSNCSRMTSITIPSSVTFIGEIAFGHCDALSSVTIPSSVTSIGNCAFLKCNSLTDINVDVGNQNYSSQGGVLYNKDKSCLIHCPAKLSGMFSIPDSVTSIENYAFNSCCTLTSVTIPEGVASIEKYTFSDCVSMTSMTIPEGVTSIGNAAFSGCIRMTSITIPSSVTSIGLDTFLCCSALSSVYFDGNAPSFWNFAFIACSGSLTYYCPTENKDSFASTPLSGIIGVETKPITVSAENGTIIPSTNSGMPGETISLNTAPAAGYVLQPGSLKYNDGSDHPISGNSFTMPDGDITISALFEAKKISTGGQNGTITAGTAGSATFSAATNIADGKTVTLNWCDADGNAASAPVGLLIAGTDVASNASTITVTADMTAAAGTYYFKATADGATSGVTAVTVQTANNSSGGAYTPSASPADTPKTETEVSGNTATATTTTTAIVDGSGKAAASVTQSQVSDMVSKAVEEATKQGNDTAAVAEIKVDAAANVKTVETALPKVAVDILAGSKADALTISTPIGYITFDSKALDTIAMAAAADVKVTVTKIDAGTLDQEAKQLVGDRPVFNFSVTSGNNTITQFGGNISVSVPYTPKAGEDITSIVIYYINAQGKPEAVRNSAYDPATGMVRFSTSHFSTYAVGYNKVSYKDVPDGVWYTKPVSFIAARGIPTGTDSGNYNPNAKLTRGDFLVMLMKAYGIEPDTNPKGNFSDAGSTYYTGYLAVAKRLAIAGGVGNNKYAPDKEISRQEMVTLLYNALKVTDKLPQGNLGKALPDFSDAGKIASWAKDAMTLFVKTGTIGGSYGKLSPTGTMTRAEMAQVLYNLLTNQ